jgi:hypothetical protein
MRHELKGLIFSSKIDRLPLHRQVGRKNESTSTRHSSDAQTCRYHRLFVRVPDSRFDDAYVIDAELA